MGVQRTTRFSPAARATVELVHGLSFMAGAGRMFKRWLVVLGLVLAAWGSVAGEPAAAGVAAAVDGVAAVRRLTLPECVSLALAGNRRRGASRHAVSMAEAQHRQALSGYWPQVHFSGGFLRLDEAANFVFPATTVPVPAGAIAVPAGSVNVPAFAVTIPAGVLGPGVPAADVLVPVPAQTVTTPGQVVTTPAHDLAVPEQEVDLVGQSSWLVSVQGQYLLWDGGWRRALREQAWQGVRAAREASRRTDLEVLESVTRLYWGAVLAARLKQEGDETLERMEATLSLTERLYQEGAGRIRKTDYLENRLVVEALRSAVALLERNVAMSRAALANTLGLSWRASVCPADETVPYVPLEGSLDELVADAYIFNPDWARMEASVSAAEAEVRAERAGHAPKVVLTGTLNGWWNRLDSGMATDENKQSWTVGVGMEWPLFEGFRTRERVREARALLAKRREERVLLREGLALQVRTVLFGLVAAGKRFEATGSALATARENRALNERAYKSELVETEDVVSAQLMAALATAVHCRVRYEHAALLAKLDLLVGSAVRGRLVGAAGAAGAGPGTNPAAEE